MTTVRDVSDRAGIVLTDPDCVRWTLPEREFWINDGLRELLLSVPSAYVKHVTVVLDPGEIQAVPKDCRTLVELRQSYLPSDALAGTVPRVSRSLLSDTAPKWAGRPGRGNVSNYCYDASDPRWFYVFPPQPEADQGSVELVYYAIPPFLTVDDTLPVNDDYVMPLVNYTLFRAYSKDAEYAANASIATAYYQAFKAGFAPPG
jgi:hypothetical protein